MPSAVYILVNSEAQRVKVGMTTSSVELRIQEANDLWFEHKLTCQVCGTRRLAKLSGLSPRVVPKHTVSGQSCPGGNAPPLEWDTSLAQAHLSAMKNAVARGEKVSFTRQIHTLEERIKRRRQKREIVGRWTLATTYHTARPGEVEKLSHNILSGHLDTAAPFGEVFVCSLVEAQNAVEAALSQLNLHNHFKRDDF